MSHLYRCDIDEFVMIWFGFIISTFDLSDSAVFELL